MTTWPTLFFLTQEILPLFFSTANRPIVAAVQPNMKSAKSHQRVLHGHQIQTRPRRTTDLPWALIGLGSGKSAISLGALKLQRGQTDVSSTPAAAAIDRKASNGVEASTAPFSAGYHNTSRHNGVGNTRERGGLGSSRLFRNWLGKAPTKLQKDAGSL